MHIALIPWFPSIFFDSMLFYNVVWSFYQFVVGCFLSLANTEVINKIIQLVSKIRLECITDERHIHTHTYTHRYNIKTQKCTYKYAKNVSLIILFAFCIYFHFHTLSISVPFHSMPYVFRVHLPN